MSLPNIGTSYHKKRYIFPMEMNTLSRINVAATRLYKSQQFRSELRDYWMKFLTQNDIFLNFMCKLQTHV